MAKEGSSLDQKCNIREFFIIAIVPQGIFQPRLRIFGEVFYLRSWVYIEYYFYNLTRKLFKETCIDYVEILVVLLPVASPDNVELVVDDRHALGLMKLQCGKKRE